CRGDCKKREVCGDGLLDAGERCDDGFARCSAAELGTPGSCDADGLRLDASVDNPNDGCDACGRVTWQAAPVLGFGAGAGVALDTAIGQPIDVLVAPDGDVYFSDAIASRVMRYRPSTGRVSLFAGSGTRGSCGDEGPAP